MLIEDVYRPTWKQWVLHVFLISRNWFGNVQYLQGDYAGCVLRNLTLNLWGMGVFLDAIDLFLDVDTREVSFFIGIALVPDLFYKYMYIVPDLSCLIILYATCRVTSKWFFVIWVFLLGVPTGFLMAIWFTKNAITINPCSWIGIVLGVLFMIAFPLSWPRGLPLYAISTFFTPSRCSQW